MKTLYPRLIVLMLLSSCAVASAQIKVEAPWVRATVPGQQATGAFMKITSGQAVKLIAVTTPAANIHEIHEMKMEGGVMKMRAHLSGLDIPANETIELKAGGYHVMMMDLQRAVKAGETVAMQLQFADARGNRQLVAVSAKVSFKNPYLP